MKIVSVINYKGGVGKTTLTANLGAYTASKGYRVLMIDLDPQMYLTFNFLTIEEWRDQCEENKTMRNFFEPVLERENIPSISSLITNIRNDVMILDIISSHLMLVDIDTKLSGLLTGNSDISLAAGYMKSVTLLDKALNEIRDKYDLILIDCPPNYNLTVKTAMYASDYYLVPTKLDFLSTMGIDSLEENIENYKKECDYHSSRLKRKNYKPLSLKMLGVVPMMVNIVKGREPQKVQREYLDKLKDKYHVFQFVRNNSEMFGTELTDKYGKKVPAVLAHLKADPTKVKIKGELKILCDEFLTKLEMNWI